MESSTASKNQGRTHSLRSTRESRRVSGNVSQKERDLAINRWQHITKEFHVKAYGLYKQGNIYPQMIIRCNDNLNLPLLMERARVGLKQNNPGAVVGAIVQLEK